MSRHRSDDAVLPHRHRSKSRSRSTHKYRKSSRSRSAHHSAKGRSIVRRRRDVRVRIQRRKSKALEMLDNQGPIKGSLA